MLTNPRYAFRQTHA